MISVIVPVYNGSAYIERCINSITGSTFRDIEIIAVENGSTDQYHGRYWKRWRPEIAG